MAQQTSYSPPKQITVEGQKYVVRTATTWNDKGSKGTIDTTIPPTVQVQYKPDGPFQSFRTLADRTNDPNVNNGWSFRPVAGPGFKKELVKSGPNSLTSQLDKSAVDQVAKDAVVPQGRAQEALSSKTLTQTNKKLAAANQDPNAVAGGLNKSQQNQSDPGFQLSQQLSTKEGTRTSFSNLVYPRDMSPQQDRLKIDIIEFRKRGFEGLTFAQRDQSVTTENSKGSVTLPIPGNVSDDNRVSWGSQNMNAAEAALASAALQAIEKGGGAFEKIGSDAVKLVRENAGDLQQGFANFFAGQAAGVSGLLARTQGAVLNPNTELLFQGPALRSFSFSFKLTPRSEAEAKTVRSIIRFFKQGMAVQRTKKDLFLKAPMIFKLQFLKGSTDLHTFLPKVKLCALLGCSVNYTPEGNYATYRDSSMVSYEMALTFNELDPIFNDDYGNSQNAADTDIGF